MRGTSVLVAAALMSLFLVTISWFGIADVYHLHFFEAGWMVAAYNVFRIVFGCMLAWIVYATGYGLLAAALPLKSLATFRPLERAVLGFGIGIGAFHVILFALGLAGLYYPQLMLGLCLIVLCASAPHFRRVACESFVRLRSPPSPINIANCAIILIAAFWLLPVKGLYPGGGGDYYSHYFKYYLEVIHNHGLRPNDVWYHYYYSSGAGPFFLGMLLTDPEAPALVTYSCVVFSAVGLATLCARMCPGSLWPGLGGALYLLFYLVPLGWIAGAEFQKSHEEMSALVVLTVWALCMRRLGPEEWRWPCILTAAATLVALAVLEMASCVMLGAFLGLAAVWTYLRGQRHDARDYAVLSVAAASAVVGVLLVNYLVTGLATDQALDLMLRFANLERLDQWGVLPQIVAVAWIRDNYARVAPPFGWAAIAHLRDYMRLDLLWILLGSGFLALGIGVLQRIFASRRGPGASGSMVPKVARKGLGFLGALIGSFAIMSVPLAGSQAISYVRFSTFFFPLLVLFATACWAVPMASWQAQRWPRIFAGIGVPCLLLVAVPSSWQTTDKWLDRAITATQHAARFSIGSYSLAEAYGHQSAGLPYGGIRPGALAAMRQVPPGARIWSTNVNAYCMAPGCKIESVISFKMSSRLNEILNGSPEEARKILQEEGLNYFFVSTDSPPIDMLPYSRLFRPAVIGQYLGIKWTDGSDFLLTWSAPGIEPIGPEFLKLYTADVMSAENPWFRFRKLLPQMDLTLSALRASPHPWHNLTFAWRLTRGIEVVNATYGENCRQFKPPSPYVNTARSGNATGIVKGECDGEQRCEFYIDVAKLGDPVNGCGKDFTVAYQCASDRRLRTGALPGEANGKTITLSCEAGPVVQDPAPAAHR